MQEAPAVSVITPAFNRARYIEQTVSSVLEQRSEDLEYIVVDDGSQDGTFELLEKVIDPRFRLLRHPGGANKGQAASINVGLREATGRYVVILDSDDYLAVDKLQWQAAFLDENPGFGMVYGQGEAVDENGQFLFHTLPKDHTEPSDPNRLLLDCYLALPGGAMFRRSLLEEVGFFEEQFRAAQDHDMALRLMEKARVAYRPKVAFYYRKHGESISKNALERRWQTGFEILARAAARYPYAPSTLRKRRAVLNYRLGETYWRSRRRWLALYHLAKSGALDPARAFTVVSSRLRKMV
jgi:glycosyltransferase involved in cell wall biosynthesis